MKALVTGGAGFIGSHIVDALIKRKFSVYVIDDLSTGRKEHVNPKAKFYKMDVASAKVVPLVRRIKPDFIFHTAAHIDVRKSVEDPSHDAKINILGILRLLEATRELKIKKFVFSSTGGAIYGSAKKMPTPENYPAHPHSPYGVAKLASEHYLDCLGKLWNIPVVVLRYANVYGPRQVSLPGVEGAVVSAFIKILLGNKTPTIYGDGKQTRDFVYVDDVVAANLLAMKKSVTGVFNIGSGKETSVNELFKKISKILRSKKKPKHKPTRPGEERRSVLSASRARRDLGWKPEISLEKGLCRTVTWFYDR